MHVPRLLAGIGFISICGLAFAQAHGGESQISQEQAKALQPPAAATAADVQKGRALFTQNCAMCHGDDGKAQVDAMANNAADLTAPQTWKQGSSQGEIYRSISQGAGNAMPPFGTVLTPQQRWALVAYITSLKGT